jgi:arsenate reductase (glutaredoxin)
MSIKIFGIPNCNTVKKARDWLTSNDISYEFIDFKKQIPTEPQVLGWLSKVELYQLINRKGTTWRSLTEEQQLLAQTQGGAIALMVSKPSVIKRPVLQSGDEIILGFDEVKYANLLNKSHA